MNSTLCQRRDRTWPSSAAVIVVTSVLLCRGSAAGQLATSVEAAHPDEEPRTRRSRLPAIQPRVLWKYRSDEDRDQKSPLGMDGVCHVAM